MPSASKSSKLSSPPTLTLIEVIEDGSAKTFVYETSEVNCNLGLLSILKNLGRRMTEH